MCPVLLPPGVNTIAVNKYITSYRIRNSVLSFGHTLLKHLPSTTTGHPNVYFCAFVPYDLADTSFRK